VIKNPLSDRQPLVSIVTPSYNQGHFLEETIRSVINQDYPNLEYIIVDGGSSDTSRQIIERYASRLAWWVSEPDKGQTDALNKGFARARGEILAWLNSDDTYNPHAIAEAVQCLQENPQAGMVYGDANLIDEHGNILSKFPARQTDYRRLQRGYVHIPQQASFFRADIWRQVGPLDPSFYFAMDYDLWVRIARRAPLLYRPQADASGSSIAAPWANFRLHGGGKSVVSDDRCWPEMLRVHYREGGGHFSRLVFKARLRPLIYSWLPLKARLWIRRQI
jgi:glycosyltransferase involved in cell wall biosynthesis